MNTRDPDRLGSSGTPHFATNPRGSSVMSPEMVKYQSSWWFQPTPLKNMKASWDYCSQLNGNIKNVPTHQPAILMG